MVVLISAVYFPAYWNHTGALAGPARAVKSAVAPNTRDESSDRYRMQENENLRLNIRQGGAIGRGFGVPIDYIQGSITDISSIDPMIRFVPHNGVLYILMRMGLFGGIAFWSLLGAGILTGCRLVRSRNPEVAVFGTVLACVLVGYALEGVQRSGLLHVPDRFRRGDAARSRRGGAPDRRSRPRRATGDGCCPFRRGR